MKLQAKFLSQWIQSRRTLKMLERIAANHDKQTLLLQRLVDHLVGPVTDPLGEAELRKESGVSFSRDREQVRILEFADKFYQASGRSPSEDEVLDFLEGRPV